MHKKMMKIKWKVFKPLKEKNLIIFIPQLKKAEIEKNLYIISNIFFKKTIKYYLKINVKILTCNI